MTLVCRRQKKKDKEGGDVGDGEEAEFDFGEKKKKKKDKEGGAEDDKEEKKKKKKDKEGAPVGKTAEEIEREAAEVL